MRGGRAALRAGATRPLPRAAVRAAELDNLVAQSAAYFSELEAKARELEAATPTTNAFFGDLRARLPTLSDLPTISPPELPLPPEAQAMLAQLGPALSGAAAALALAGACAVLFADVSTDTPYPSGRYNAQEAELYFSERPGAVLVRALDLLRLGGRFAISLFLDWRFRGLEKNERQRASELVVLLTRCGATFIKIGQALSIRADLLRPAYIEALSQLQDRVPAFSNEAAFAIIRAELKLPPVGAADAGQVPSVFSALSPEPVAAASLGQVYRGTVRATGQEVAVKVQRPGVLETIALDMYLIRQAAALAKRLNPWINTDLVGAVDEWGLGFVDELDYMMEAAAANNFRSQIAQTPLANVVCAPSPVLALSSRKVLTAEWVRGVRLDSAANSKGDIGKLCAVGLTSYLTMLLESGTLHCDPHPGNLLRTEDGRLCILDWGLVTRVEGELQISFLEHIAHLTSADYAAIPADLVRLGFVPAGKEEAIAQAGVAEVLATLYAQLAGGGGAAKIDVGEVGRTLTGLTQSYGNIFQIPPYFLYILRAFSVLEGIGLQNDPDYSIIDACLPYITRRLVTDQSPRSRAALRSFVSKSAASGNGRQIDTKRAQQLVGGLSEYAAATLGVNASANGAADDGIAIATRLVLDEAGNPVQSLLLEEAARVADALARDLASRVGELVERSGPAARVLDPFDTWGVLKRLLAKEAEDEEVLGTLGLLLDSAAAVQQGASAHRGPGAAQLQGALPPRQHAGEAAAPVRPDVALRSALSELDPELRNRLLREVWEQRAGAATFATRLASRVLLRASERLGRLSDPGVVDGQSRDEVFIAIASIGKAATALSAAQLDAQRPRASGGRGQPGHGGQ